MSCRSMTCLQRVDEAVQPLAAVKAQQRRQQVRVALASAAGGGTGCLPAAAPADRCPGCWPRRRARRCTMRSICACVQLHQRQHLRRDVGAAVGNAVGRHLDFAQACSRCTDGLRQRRQRRRARTALRTSRLPVQPGAAARPAAPPAASGRRARRSCRAGRRARRRSSSLHSSRQRLLDLALRRLVGALHEGVALGRRQRLAVELAVRRQRQLLQRHEGAGHHVLGQARAQVRAQRRRLDALVAAPHRPPGACRPALSSRASTTASRTPGACAQLRLDLAQLDAEAADLDLEVVAPEELDVAVRQASARGRRSCTCARRGSPQNGSATKRSAVSSGRFR